MTKPSQAFFKKEIYHLLHSDQHNPKIKQHTLERLQTFIDDKSEETRKLLMNFDLNRKEVFYEFAQKINILLNDIQFIEKKSQRKEMNPATELGQTEPSERIKKPGLQ